MAHFHGPDYGHDHEGGDLPHDHATPIDEPVELDTGTPIESGGGAREDDPGLAAAAIEAVAGVAECALETVAEVVHDHEETDRTAEVADVVETLAEEQSEVQVAEAVADADEPEAELPPVDESPEELEEEPGDPEVTAVEVPPQVEDEEEPGEHRSRSSRRAPAFRAHRVRRR